MTFRFFGRASPSNHMPRVCFLWSCLDHDHWVLFCLRLNHSLSRIVKENVGTRRVVIELIGGTGPDGLLPFLVMPPSSAYLRLPSSSLSQRCAKSHFLLRLLPDRYSQRFPSSEAARMTVLTELLNQFLGNWTQILASSLILGVGLLIAQSIYGWYRLRHIKGPFLAGFSKLWLIRTVSSGNMHWEFAKACQKYGTHH